MSEEEWLASEDPMQMLMYLKGNASDRKLRLFACACGRRVWHLISEGNRREAIEVGERFADGFCSQEELVSSYWHGWNRGTIFNHPIAFRADCFANAAAGESANPDPFEAADSARNLAQLAVNPELEDQYCEVLGGAEQLRQGALIIDIFGNPFQPIALDRSWLTSTVVSLAQQMYDLREFSAMSILADAFQDAGCENDSILTHCREPGLHVRGCFVVDLILGKL